MIESLIRPAAPTDEHAIANLWETMIAELHALDPRQPQPISGAATIYAARLMNALNDLDTRILVAESGGRVIGYSLAALVDLQSDLFTPANSGLIVDLCVAQAARRQGVGRTLVAAMMDWFAARGAVYVEWNVASANEPGRAFWRAVGGVDYQIRMRVGLPSTQNPFPLGEGLQAAMTGPPFSLREKGSGD